MLLCRRAPFAFVALECSGGTRQGFGIEGVPFSQAQFAVDLFGPDHSLHLRDAKESRFIAAFQFAQSIRHRLTTIHVANSEPLFAPPLFDCEKSVRHIVSPGFDQLHFEKPNPKAESRKTRRPAGVLSAQPADTIGGQSDANGDEYSGKHHVTGSILAIGQSHPKYA
jgi:hypothetical protein